MLALTHTLLEVEAAADELLAGVALLHDGVLQLEVGALAQLLLRVAPADAVHVLEVRHEGQRLVDVVGLRAAARPVNDEAAWG